MGLGKCKRRGEGRRRMMLYRVAAADDGANASADDIIVALDEQLAVARRAAATARGIKNIERDRCPGRVDCDGRGIWENTRQELKSVSDFFFASPLFFFFLSAKKKSEPRVFFFGLQTLLPHRVPHNLRHRPQLLRQLDGIAIRLRDLSLTATVTNSPRRNRSPRNLRPFPRAFG